MENNQPVQATEFVLRRLQEMPSSWVILLPVAFAFLVLFLVVLFRRENRWSGMLLAFLAVSMFSVVHLALAWMFLPTFSWWVVLVPVILVALAYVSLMYVKDAQTIHPLWAAFLGLLRCAVYAILAFVFLLPGCQNYDTTETHSKVVFLLDVSGSMKTVDDLPQVGEDPAKLPSRQDKVLKFLTGKGAKDQGSFLDRLLSKTPVTAYRFGAVTDDSQVMRWQDGAAVSASQLRDWLLPDKKKIVVPATMPAEEQAKYRTKMADLVDDLLGGTNVGGAAQLVSKLEAASFLQAIVVVSDGQSNLGSDEAIKDFLARVNNPKRPVPVFTIGVGEYRTPASIRIDDLQAPETARPDDKFPIRVPVVGSGLPDEEFEVTLEMRRIKDKDGKTLVAEKALALGPKKGSFKGGGDHPHDQVEFEIDLQELKNIKADKDDKGELEGTWEFVARVPRHPREAFAKAEHVSDPATHVLVMKRKLRVLLFAGGPTREYQFVRTLLYRQVVEKRMDLAVYLQTGVQDHVDQDVESEWLLSHFPNRLGPDDPRDKHSSLNEYDVIIAFDPDWTALEYQQLKNLEQWVTRDSGGIIFVGGPVHTYQLARPGGLDITPLLNIFPVVLRDSRLHGLGIGHDPSRPYVLNFKSDAKLFEFLKLDEDGEAATAGWDNFFWDGKPPTAKDAKPLRGIFNYYPVEKVRPTARVIATFAGPPSSRIDDGKEEQPYLVMLPVVGKTVFLSSGETWRLRQFKEAFHERFWIKLARYVSAGTTEQKKYGRILLGRTASTGIVSFEAQIKGENLQPLPRDVKPTVHVKRPADFDPKLDSDTPASFDLRAKSQEGEWHGWFVGNFKVRTPGEYEFRIPIPGTSESLTHRLTVRKPNLELDNVRHNHGALYQLASEAKNVLNRLPAETRRDLEQLLQPPSSEDVAREGKTGSRLFFTLPSAEAVVRCLTKVEPKTESTKGKLEDLWDRPLWESGQAISALWLLIVVPLIVGLLAFAILLFLRQNVGALVALGIMILTVLVVLLIQLLKTSGALEFEWEEFPLNLSFVMVVVVSLLAMEWLTRKLLRLA